MNNIQQDYTGSIHTAQLEITPWDGEPANRDPLFINCLSTEHRAENGVTYRARYNPGNSIHAWRSRYGYGSDFNQCESLTEFTDMLDDFLTAEDSKQRTKIIRLDFNVDMLDETKVAHWVKLNDLLCMTFVCKHGETKKNHMRTVTLDGGEHKSTKVVHGRMEIECYNKGIENPGLGIAYRLELRHKDMKKALNPVDVLKHWQKELRGLPQFYDEALQRWTEGLIAGWNSHDSYRNMAQYLQCNAGLLYKRSQVLEIYRQCSDSTNPNAAADRWSNQNPDRDFIGKGELIGHVNGLCQAIESFITSCE